MAPTNLPRDTLTRLPEHVAIVMDGNGRWATQRNLPRTAGHREGVKAVRRTVETCSQHQIKALTLFAFSSENWRRPQTEVSVLMRLFLATLRTEVRRLIDNNVRLRFIGERGAFSVRLQKSIDQAERDTVSCTGLTLVIAANYGGRWDISNAARAIVTRVLDQSLDPADIDPALFHRYTDLSDLPEPDLFIRTGGERRISNFLLWQLAYTELYFSDELWPDFNGDSLKEAFTDFARRQRRFGLTGDQIKGSVDA